MYKAFFGLRAKPFRLNPDPRFLFGSRGAKRALDFLRFGLYQREGMVLLTGDTGVGKTLLVRSLMPRLAGNSATVAQVQPLLGGADELLRQISAGFGAEPGTSSDATLTALRRQLLATAQAGRRAVLVVDEAQNLDAAALELLRMLSNLLVGAASAMQIVLVARTSLRRTLAGNDFESLRQRVVAADHLEALDADEVGPYIGWRLQRAGWQQAELFDDAAIDAVLAATQAVPRRINKVCDRLLMQAFVEGRTGISGADIAPVIEEMATEWSPALAGSGSIALPRSAAAPSTPSPSGEAASTVRMAADLIIATPAAHDVAPGELGEPDEDARGGESAQRFATLESRMAALEASTAQVAKISRAILGRIDAGNPV